jgi:hypothetical protein
VRLLIAHAAWLSERKRTLSRLLEQLGSSFPVHVLSSRNREHASLWARRLWTEAAATDEDVICLNDDVEVCPRFFETCEAMTSSVPDEILSLHANMPGAREESQKGANWVRCYWLTGPAYLLPAGTARQLLDYWDSLPWAFGSRINEDNLAIHWAWEKQRPMYCSIPAPVTHDASVKSSLGYDHHPHRTPTVPWTDYADPLEFTKPSFWTTSGDAPLVPNPWMPPEKLEYMRRVLSEGGQFCPFCSVRQGVVGPSGGPLLCPQCVAESATALILNKRHT